MSCCTKNKCSLLVLPHVQMHEFIVTKDAADEKIDIFGLYGSKNLLQDSWLMRKTSVRAKPNSQVAEWSPKIWLVKSLPSECSVPGGTPKFHLFRKLTREKKMIEQSPEELELKFAALKKTVSEVSQMRQFDADDGVWWEKFFSDRDRRRSRIGDGEEEDCEPDEASLKLVTKLLWPDPGTANIQLATTDRPEEKSDETGEGKTLDDLEAVLRPRTTPARADEFGRKRKTGYVTVRPGENRDEQFAAAVARRRVTDEEKLNAYFVNLKKSRGETESKFIEKQLKVRMLVVMIYIFFSFSFYDSSCAHKRLNLGTCFSNQVGSVVLLDCSGAQDMDKCSIPLPKRLITSAELRLGNDAESEGDDSDEEEDDDEADGVQAQDELLEEYKSDEVVDEDDHETEVQAAPATGSGNRSKVR